MAELRSVDPATLTPNPDNLRRAAASPAQDEQLLASVRIVGLIQPPRVADRDGSLIIVAGHRRVRAAIAAGLDTIDVLIGPAEEDADAMRSVAENIVRAPLTGVDIWRAIEALEARHWTEQAVADALALTIRTVRRLKLLAKVHAPMLEAMNAGSMPGEDQLRAIAAASPEEQAQVWKKHRPKKGQQVAWWEIARALTKRRIPFAAAKFDEELGRTFGVVWMEDLFAPADEDGRYTTNVEGFFAAQQQWLQDNLPTGGTTLPIDQHGQPSLPKKAERIYGKPGKGDRVGHYLDNHTGEVKTVAYRIPDDKKPAKGKGRENGDATTPEPEEATKPRPDITQKGSALIGALRTDALHAALLETSIDDPTLLGLLVLAFAGRNVSVQAPGDRFRSDREDVAATLMQGGVITADTALIRTAARTVLASVLSCNDDATASGVVARVAGEVVGASTRLPHMATEEFLSCLSKPALERTATAERVAPRPTGKATRAAMIAELAGRTWVHPAALFRLSAEELNSLHSRRRTAPSHDQADSAEDGDNLPSNDDGEDLPDRIPEYADDYVPALAAE